MLDALVEGGTQLQQLDSIYQDDEVQYSRWMEKARFAYNRLKAWGLATEVEQATTRALPSPTLYMICDGRAQRILPRP